MNYLKCNHCGHLNALRSEYVTFCESCNKKMNNSYTDWKMRNPAGTFEQYCETIGVTDAQLATAIKARKKVSTGKILLVTGIVLVVVFTGVMGAIFGKDVFAKLKGKPKHVPEEWILSKWNTFSTPHGLLKVDLPPLDMKPFDQEFPEAIRPHLSTVEIYRGDTTLPLVAYIYEIAYKPDVQVSLEGAAAGGIAALQQAPGVSNFDYKQDTTRISGQRCISVTGGYTANNISDLSFHILVIVKEHRLMTVTLSFPANDENAASVASRIITSIKLKNI